MQTSPSEGANAPAETDWDMEIDVVGLGSSPKTGIIAFGSRWDLPLAADAPDLLSLWGWAGLQP